MTRGRMLGFRLGALGLLLGLMIGCSDSAKKVGVSGTVTYDGKAVSSGTIEFTPADPKTKGTASAAEIKDGRYAVADATVGKTRILVRGKIDAPKGEGAPKGGKGAMGGMKMAADPYAAAMKMKAEGKSTEEIERAMSQSSGTIAASAEGNNQVHEITGAGQTLNITLGSKGGAAEKPKETKSEKDK